MADVPDLWWLLGAAALYLAFLFLVAELAERRVFSTRLTKNPWVFSLSLGVYATSWTFFGSVGMADDRGYAFLTIYMGVSLACLAIPVLWLPLLRIVRQHRLANIADLFAFRFRSQAVAVLVSAFLMVASIPYLALQIRALNDSAVILSGSPAARGPALAFTGLITVFALLFSARHLTGNDKHRGLVLAIALESLVKTLALAAIGVAAIVYGFGDGAGFAAWTAAHPEKVESLFAPVREEGFTTLLLLSFGAGFLLPRQFHLAFAERPDDEAMLGATWRFPLLLLLLCLVVPPILWAGHRLAPGSDPDTFALELARGHPALAVVVYVGGLAASSGMMIVSSVALASMAVNHLLLPWWRPRGGELLATVAWARRFFVGLVLLLAYGFFLLFARDSRLASLGLIAFVAVVQLLPGAVSVLYYRGASRRGLFLGLLAGILGWTVMLALPQLGLVEPAQAVSALAAQINPEWTDIWTVTTVVSLGPNVLVFALGSILLPPSADELAAAEECGLDVEAGARRLRRPASPGLLKVRLGPLLGAQTANLLVERAAREVDLEPADTSPEKLRRLEEQVQAALTALLGPLLGPAVLDGVNLGATSQLAAQVRFLEERLHRAPTGALAQVEMVRRYLKGVLDDLPLGVCALGPDDDVVVWNRSLEQLSGLFARDWVGHELDELPAPFGPALADWTRDTPPPGEEVLEIDDEKRSLGIRVSPLAGGGKVVTLEDLTAQRRLEDQLVHEDRLRSLGQLTAAIGHEIGNPLTGILMLARNLAAEKEPEDLQERLEMIVSEAEKIESIVRSMTSFARAGSDHALAGERHREEPVVLQDVIEDAFQLVRIGRKSKAIHWSYQCEEDVVVLGDRQQLTQVLVNLLTNASDASAPGQDIQVSVRPRGTRSVELDVTDRGEGIPEAVAQRIFEPFFTTKRPGAGTGLGLAVSEGIIRAHGGRLEVYSERGEGTTMRVVLRRALEEVAS